MTKDKVKTKLSFNICDRDNCTVSGEDTCNLQLTKGTSSTLEITQRS